MKFQNKKMSLVFVGIVLALSLLSIHSSAQSWLAFYKIETWTGKVDGAGTDANVFITLFGNRGTTREISLDNPENNFEWGKWDEFRARAREVGNIQKIRIRHDNSGRGPGWFLDKVRVTGSQGSKADQEPGVSNLILRLTSSRTLKRRERRAPVRSVPVSRNSNPIEFDGFGNCGEFAIIKSQADESHLFLIPSNSTGLKARSAAILHN